MAKFFADRAIVIVAGREILHLQSASLDVSYGRQPVDTMSRSRLVSGFTRGNKVISVSLSSAIEERVHGALLESIDYELTDVDIAVEIGGEKFTVISVWLNNFSINAGGVGSEGTKNWDFGGTDIVSENGSSVTDAFALGAAAASTATQALGL